MEDLQSTLRSILSDPEQMARVAALAESLGLKQPEPGAEQAAGAAGVRPSEADGDGMQHAKSKPENGGTQAPDRFELPLAGALNMGGIDLPGLMSRLSALNGSEDRVLNALRSGLDAAGQSRVDRALRAAKLSRLAGQLLRSREGGHV